jgi:hypothetical protein
MRHFAEPANDAKLEVFILPSRDVLVRYDELRERDGTTRQRAYLLSKNVDRIRRHEKPRFCNPASIPDLQAVPVTNLSIVQPDLPRVSAGYSSDRKTFELIGIPGLDGTYELPVYVENNGAVLRMALTPFAIAGDIVVVGAVVGVAAAYAYAHGAVYQ